MGRALGIVIVLVAACSQRSASGVKNVGGPTSAAMVPCPEKRVVEDRLRALWSIPAGHDLDATCTPGRFPAPGWAVAAVVDTSEDEAYDRSVVLAAVDGAAIAQTDVHGIAPWYRAEGGGGISYQVLDFDGDGIGELVSRSGASHGGSTTDSLTIDRLAGSTLERVFSVTTHYDNGGAAEDEADVIECNTDVAFVPDGAAISLRAVGRVETRRTDQTDDDDCFTGARTYRLTGGRFVLAPR